MKSYSRARLMTVLSTASVLTLAVGVAAFRAQADEWDKKTILTVDQPIQVRNTYLNPGTYVFKLMDSSSNRHIVQIFNSDQTKIIDTILAIPNYRLQPTGKSRFTFWETPPGSVRAMRAWFYPGDNVGQEFTYPKNLRQLEVASVVTPAPTVSQTQTTETQVTELAPQPEPQVAVTTPEPETKVEERTEIAQVTPPAQQPEASPNPEPEPAPTTTTTQELPKTASPYTPIGLFGLGLLGLYGVLRVRKVA
jgi:hypothetical protein